MASSREKWTISGVLAIVAGAIGLVTGWPTVGWMTPNGHAADVAEVKSANVLASQEVLEAIENLGLKVDTYNRQWECDEKEEELMDLLREQVENNSVEIRRDIAKAEKWLDDNDCSDFDEVG